MSQSAEKDALRCGWTKVEDGFRWRCVLDTGHTGDHVSTLDLSRTVRVIPPAKTDGERR